MIWIPRLIFRPAQELQAIGRVHRIGQTKTTVVHRFLIRSTVEERMYTILSSYQRNEAKQGSHSTEENLITIKDLKNIFNDECEDDSYSVLDSSYALNILPGKSFAVCVMYTCLLPSYSLISRIALFFFVFGSRFTQDYVDSISAQVRYKLSNTFSY
ncbi:SHPRH [Lepeophtheirus salmonis]|uniref:SHPRH n=1 Tax=Lepeophtheirus salmonis TaxID=72036 RepID=A0A7R8CZV4_LEPSM|nr:SHPRH [Lepeophtheirus salmonis]CAF2979246.1 SHPRH [Lepeophtheirus salmonis]